MNSDERQMLQGLFTRLGEAERGAPPRDGDAESFIHERVSSAPHLPYYMAQTIIVQEEALKAAGARIQELEEAQREQPRQSGGGGFLSGLFGSSQPAAPQRNERPMGVPAGYRGGPQQPGVGAQPQRGGPWGGAAPMAGGGYGQQPGFGQQPMQQTGRGGGGFLAGAAQTAVGVAGGVMLGSMLGSMFSGTDSFLNPEAQAAEGGDTPAAEPAAHEELADNGYDDANMQDVGYDDPGFGGGDDFEDI